MRALFLCVTASNLNLVDVYSTLMPFACRKCISPIIRTALTAAAFLISACCFSQAYVLNRLSQSEGLASNFVHGVWQDKQGFIWIGSDNGLQRYDGHSFFSPNVNTRTSLPFAAVNQIVADGKGRMWLRCGNIVGIFDPGTFQFRAATVNKPANSEIDEQTSLCRDVSGKMYLLQKGNTVLYFDEASFSFHEKYTPYKFPKEWRILLTFDDSVTQRTWLGFYNRLACYDWQTKQLWYKGNNPRNLFLLNDTIRYVSSFDIDGQRKYWLTFWRDKQTFLCYDEKTNRYTTDTTGLSKNNGKGYFEMKHISVFSDSMHIAYGINVFQATLNNRFEHMEDVTPAGSLQYENIEQVFEDRQGIIWIASDNGLYNLTTESRKAARLELPKKTGIVFNSACQLPDGDILLYGFGHGIFRYDEKLSVQKEIIKAVHPDENFQKSWCLYSNTADSTVWIGCQFGRLMIYEFKTGKLNYYHPAQFRRGTMTRAIADKNGYMWVGLSNGDIFRIKQGSAITASSFEFMCNVTAAVTEMFFHTDGNLYAGTRGAGAFAISAATGKINKQYTTSSSTKLTTNQVGDLCAVNDSIVCFSGDIPNLVNIRTGSVTYLSQYNDELLGELYVQIQDKNKDIWFVGTNGFFRYTPDRGYLQKFTQREGLHVPKSSIAILERRLLRNGNILLAGNLNAMLFNPNNYRSADKPSTVFISNFRLGNTYLPLDSIRPLKTIHLNRDQNTLAISFAIPDFNQSIRHIYLYKLEGADRDWIKAGDVREARYSLLPPGTYTFRVKAQNAEGHFSEQTTSLRIVIHPPFWKTWWFMLLIIMSAAFIAYQLHRLRIRQLMRVEKVRSRLASDLHDDMGSTLSTINILTSIAINKVGKNDQEVSSHLKNIGQSSSRVMEAIDDIVWSINPRNDNMQKISARMREFASNTLESQDIILSFTIDEKTKELKFDMESRKDIFLLFKESINNIAKYADATSVNIALKLERKTFVMLIQDNGKGFDPAAPLKETRGNGLRNMKVRAEAIKGNLTINAEPGKGTQVELRVPVRE
jgi:signal transduction histidine kinase/streptogramin lyase